MCRCNRWLPVNSDGIIAKAATRSRDIPERTWIEAVKKNLLKKNSELLT